MKPIRMKTLSGMAVIALLAASSASEAKANHLRKIDDLAWRLERTAVRADRDVRYNFRYAPVAKCLRENFCLIAEKADDLQQGANRNVAARLIRDMEECLDEIDDSVSIVQDRMAKLEAWVRTCRSNSTARYGRLTISSCSVPSEYALRRLCGRVEDMKEIVQCLYNEIEALIDQCGIRETRRDGRPNRVGPPPAVSPHQPVLPPAAPSGHRGIGRPGIGNPGIGGPGLGGPGFGGPGIGNRPIGHFGHAVAHRPVISRKDRQTAFWINFALSALR